MLVLGDSCLADQERSGGWGQRATNRESMQAQERSPFSVSVYPGCFVFLDPTSTRRELSGSGED